jgi:hypothetical protein
VLFSTLSIVNRGETRADAPCFAPVLPELSSFKSVVQNFLQNVNPLLNRRSQALVESLRSTAGTDEVDRLKLLDQRNEVKMEQK